MKRPTLALLLAALAALLFGGAGSPAGASAALAGTQLEAVPTITDIAPKVGFFRGGTKVRIVGTNLDETTSVHFGSIPAPSFAVESPTLVVAVAPLTGEGSRLHVTVATASGLTATSTGTYEATACRVPKLKGRGLAAARTALRRSRCALGKVARARGARARTARVVQQGPQAGKFLPPGHKVNVWLR